MSYRAKPLHSQKRRWTAPLLLLVFAAITHGPGLWGQFVMDDWPDVIQHPVVSGGQPWWRVISYNYMGKSLDHGANTIRPLTTLSFRVEWGLWGATPWLFHLSNLLIFFLLLWLVYELLSSWFDEPAATMGALLFAVLAVHVEVVASVANRAELWSLLLAVASFLAARRDKTTFAVSFYFLSLLGKESSFLLPLIVAWAAFSLDGRAALGFRRQGKTVLVLLGAAAVYLLLRSLLLPLGIGGRIIPADNPLIGQPLGVRAWMAFLILGKYLWVTLYPLSLSSDYTYSSIPAVVDFAQPFAWLGVSFVLLNGALIVRYGKKMVHGDKEAAMLVFSIGAFFLSYLLFSNSVFLIVTIFAERLFFAPSLWLIVWALSIVQIFKERLKAIPLSSALGVAFFLSFVIWQVSWGMMRSTEWHDDLSLNFSQVIKQPNNVKGHLYLAKSLVRRGRHASALWHLAIAIQGRSHFPRPWRAPREFDHLPIERRISHIPQIIGPDRSADAVKREFYRMAIGVLGPRVVSTLREHLPLHAGDRP